LEDLDGTRLHDLDGDGGDGPTIASVYGTDVARAYRSWDAATLEAGLVCPQWSFDYGGLDLDAVAIEVLDDEFGTAGMPRVLRGVAEGMLGPAVLRHGTEAQRRTYLPRIISGADRWGQGFSEPGSGSDLASLRTNGMVVADDLVINGQKVWTTGAQRASMFFLLCRTSVEARRQAGITYVIVPRGAPGLEVRPIRQITGHAEFCELFLTDVRVPLANVVGSVGAGWEVAKSTLESERTAMLGQWSRQLELELDRLLQRTRELCVSPAARQALVRLWMDVRRLSFHRQRMLADGGDVQLQWRLPLLSKLLWSEIHQRLTEVAMDLLGASAQAGLPSQDSQHWQHELLWSRCFTIAGGTSEIQRNILAEVALGLPREAG
jgi:alkylation response protein AidB-like acyl-CoA dehydrogenase